MRKVMLSIWLSVFLVACKHPIEIIGGGDVLSESGDRDCSLEEFQAQATVCTENTVSDDYLETYYAQARPGWQFSGWGYYCPDNGLSNECTFNLSKEFMDAFPIEEAAPLIAYFRREVDEGHNALLMGHSFFKPFASALPGDAAAAGFEDHSQIDFFSGGSGGAPLSFWNHQQLSGQIKTALDDGGYTLLGMTYYPLQENGVPVAENLQGYKNWIDYALAKNPNIKVFIGMPWGRNSNQLTYKQFYQEWKMGHEEVHDFIDALRADNPGMDIYCLPYGLAVMELNKRFESGQLPDIIGEVGAGRDYMFSDELGHHGPIVFDLARLVWLRAIYGVELETHNFNYAQEWQADLVEIANLAMNRHDHYYDAR
jgi:hypothetical protein